MYYDKQIRYIDYLENGEKRYNCGYVKITVADSKLVLEMQIRGLYETDDVAAEVIVEGAGRENRIGAVLIRQGSGSFRWETQDPVYQGEEITVRDGLRYGQLERIHMQLSPQRSLQCIWRKAAEQEELRSKAASPVAEQMPEPEGLAVKPLSVKEQAAKPEVPPVLAEGLIPVAEEPSASPEGLMPESKGLAPEAEEQPVRLVPEAEAEGMSPTDIHTEINRGWPIEEAVTEEPPETVQTPLQPTDVSDTLQEISGAAVPKQPGNRDYDREQEGDGRAEAQRRALHGPRTAAMSEDKWRQLWKIYPHIRPFQDEREYLFLRPEDFVILCSNAYRLAHNSFLLHGYYNYEHLILTQMSVKGANRYYIGVPGNFYEKEKQVAIMFGFESFECRQEPAQEGDFGYYMIRVEL